MTPPKKRSTAGIHWLDAPSEYVRKPKPTCGENGPRLLCEARGGQGMWMGGGAATSFHVRASSGTQWWQAPGQAGSGGPVGCPIINGASLGEVLEHLLEAPHTPASLLVGFGSRNDSKSFEPSPKRWQNEVRQS